MVDLTALVPSLMARHPELEWRMVDCLHPGDEAFVMWPRAEPERMVRVQVDEGLEIFALSFAGHTYFDYAYEDEERPEALQGMVDLGVALARGPSRVVLDIRADRVLRSRLVAGSDGDEPRVDQVSASGWPEFRTLRWFSGRRSTRYTLVFGSLQSDLGDSP